MGLLRPATPGFLITLLATALLAVVSFSVPYFKSVFFLKASLSVEGVDGSITFGTLGYCLELANGTTCSKPSVGYELNINALVGNKLPIQIPDIAVKWITYALVLHVVALILAAISAFFGLLAHVREMSMTCFSSCIAGFAATVALLAFIFDLVLFFIAKSRLNAVSGGSASMGTGIWLTLAAWLCLTFAGCFFGIGRCCIRRRSRDADKLPSRESAYHEQLRLDAVKAEADRKARQAGGKMEQGLPVAMYETEPLTGVKQDSTDEIYIDDGDKIVAVRPGDSQPATPGRQGAPTPHRQPSGAAYAGGYAQAAPGTRAMDDYNNLNPRRQPSTNTYPPQQQVPYQPRRQASALTQASGYSQASGYGQTGYTVPPVSTMPAMPTANLNVPNSTGQYGADQYGHSQYTSAATSAQNYGAHSRGATYQNTASHQQYPTAYSSNQYADLQQPQDTFNSDTYNNTAYMQPGVAAYPSATAAYTTQDTSPYAQQSASQPYSSQQQHSPERSYTLGGGAYGSTQADDGVAYYGQYATGTTGAYATPTTDPYATGVQGAYATGTQGTKSSHLPSPYSPLPTPESSHISTPTTATTAPLHVVNSAGPSNGHPQRMPSLNEPMYEDSPPMYDDATAQPAGEWSSKQRS